VPAAIALAAMVKDDRAVIDALIEMSRGQPASLVPGLRSAEAGAVKATLRTLRGVGDATLSPELADALQQGDPDVRLEAIATLQAWGGEQAAQMLEPLLKDEDQRIRSVTVQALGRVRGTSALEALVRMISEKTFLARPLEEKRQAFAALAHAGGEAALPMLDRVLRERRWVHARKQNETRACAAHALGLVGTPAAAEILEPFRNDRSAIVRAACRTALDRIATDRKEEPENG
jgi:HEAT repeat protein